MKQKILALSMGILTMLAMSMATLSDPVSVTTTVSGYMTATFNYDTVAYSSQSAGASDVVAPGQADGNYNVTIDTNNNYKVSASGTQFSDGGGHTFAVSNLKMHGNTTADGLSVDLATVLSGAPQVIATGFTPSDTDNYNGFWLSIPGTQFGAPYTSTLTVTYAAV